MANCPRPGSVSVCRTPLGKVTHGKPNMNESSPNTIEGRAKVSRSSYDEAFKRSPVEHYHRHGGTIQRAARELSINCRTLRGWIQAQSPPSHPQRPLPLHGGQQQQNSLCPCDCLKTSMVTFAVNLLGLARTQDSLLFWAVSCRRSGPLVYRFIYTPQQVSH